jgi:hypothetical protein
VCCKYKRNAHVSTHSHFKLIQSVPLSQITELAQLLPERVGCCCMSYMQAGSSSYKPMQPSCADGLQLAGASSNATSTAAGVRKGGGEEGDSVPRITFLYKAVPGIAEASFGLSVASMANLPAAVIARAAKKAAEAEAQNRAAHGEGKGVAGVMELRQLAAEVLQQGMHMCAGDMAHLQDLQVRVSRQLLEKNR